MLNALRLNDGVSIARFRSAHGSFANVIARPLAEARERDWLEADDRRMRPTESGRRFLNDLTGLFLTD